MCLTIRPFRTRQQARDFAKKPLIAEKDIVVYKRLVNRGLYLTPPHYSYFRYWRKTLHTVPKFSFKISSSGDKCWACFVHRGLHVYTSKRRAYDSKYRSEQIFKCIIPKGSLYFIKNEIKQIVTNRLYIGTSYSK